MSVGDHEIEEPDDEMEYCEMHNVYHSTWACAECMNDESERRIDNWLNKKHGMD